MKYFQRSNRNTPFSKKQAMLRHLPVSSRLLPAIPVLAAIAGLANAQAATVTWNNSGTNFNDGASWDGGAPTLGDTALFGNAANTNPNLASALSIGALNFSTTASSGYLFTADPSAILTLTATGTGTSSAINAANTSGTNTIGVNLNLGAAAGSTQTFNQASGGTLVLDGTISGGGAGSTLTYSGNGTYQINSANTYTGTTKQTGSGTIIIGNKAAFGGGVLNVSGGTFQAGIDLTGANKITNDLKLAGALKLGNSSHGIEFGGNVDLGGAARSINAGLNAGGVEFSGVISNDNGAGLTISRGDASSNVVLSGENTYTGATTIYGVGVSVSHFGNAGEASNLGESGTVKLGGNVSSQTSRLFYTGAGETTDKSIALNSSTGSLSIDTTGATGGLVFTSDFTTAAGSKTLTLSGDSIGNAIKGNLVDGSGSTLGITKTGSGTWALAGTNTYTGLTTANAGVLRLDSANAISGGIGTTGGTSALIINGAVIGLGAGDFTRGIGSGVTQVKFIGSGGFAAYGADRVVNLGGASADVIWKTNEFMSDNGILNLGAADADATVDLQNGINLNNVTRTVQVDNGSAAIDATLSGILSNGSLTKTGDGTLKLTASNTYTGATEINAGTLNVAGAIAGAVNVNATGTLNGSGTTGAVTVKSGGKAAGQLSTGTMTVSAGGNLAPGDSTRGVMNTGDLTFQNSNVVDSQITTFSVTLSGNADPGTHAIAGTDYDQASVTGGVSIGSNVDLRIALGTLNTTFTVPSLNPYSSTGPNTGFDNFFIILNDDTDLVSGQFYSVNGVVINYDDNQFSTNNPNGIGTFFVGSQQFAISYTGDFATNSTTGGNDVTLTAIPEPGTWAMLASGLGLFAFGQYLRRRRHSTI